MTSYSIAEYKQMIGGAKPKRGTKRPKVKSQKVPNEYESKFALELKALKIDFEQEFKFHQSRKWRADFHLKGRMILIEVEGGIWSGGRHTRGKGYLGDMEKYNSAAALGYQVYRFSTEQVRSGVAIEQILKLIG